MREAVLFEVFLYLRKAYDALDRERDLEILSEYRVSPSMVRLLQNYWDRMTMVAKADGYFRRLFKGYQGVTQGDPLSHTIFNVVVDAIIRHWVTVVETSEVGTGGLVMKLIELSE